MKTKLLFALLLLVLLSFESFSQGVDCLTSDPFCTGTTYDFPAGTNVPDMGSVGCLGTTPNPAWYYLQIANPGPISIYMSSTPNVDIDFICWGPFTSVPAACASNLMTNSGVDCSYSTNWNETCTIPNGQTGEIYILLITNYSNTVCDISFSQTGGTGTTDCSIMCPGLTNNGPLCVGQTLNLTANPVSGATYAWTGPNGFTSALQNPSIPIVSLADAGVYSLVVTVGGVPSQPCSTTVVINPPPIIAVNSPSMCAGTSATLTATGGVTYSWSGGLGTGNPMVVSPGSTTSYTVTGTDANGCTNTAVATVTVDANPTVTVNSPTICSGLSATLTANGASTYSWSGGLGTGNPKIVSPGSTTSYTVTGTSVNGCTGTAVASVTVTPGPSITVNSPTICAGTSATLTANGGTTYSWSGGLGTGNPVTAMPGSTTTYTVTGTSSGCTGTAVSTVTVNPNPAVTVNSPTICLGTSATLTANGGTTYSWSGGLGTGNPVTAMPGSTTSYTVTGTTAGCTGTAVATVTVTPNPTITVNSPTICAGTSATLTANGGTTYSWSGGLGTGNPVTAMPGSTTTYTVTGTSSGCTGTAVSTVTVNPNPAVTVNSPTICLGTSATLTANGGTTYSWSGGLGTGNPVTAMPGSTTTYTVTGTSSGCTGTAVSTVTVNPNPVVTVNSPTICLGTSATLTANGATSYSWSGGLGTGNPVTVSPGSTTTYTVTGTTSGCTGTAVATVTISPGLNITVNSPTICNGFSATLTANGGTTYTWSNFQNTNPITVSPGSTSSYTVTGTTNGCTGTAVATVTVNPNPMVTVNSPAICAGFTATLTANNATTYSWSGGLGTGNPKSVTPGSTTSYTVTGTDGNGCIGTAVSTVIVNANPQPSVTTTNSTCSNNNGTANCSLSGLNYQWSNSLTTQNITSLPAGNYSVTVTDGNGCSGTASGVILGFPGPTVSAVSTDENCGHANGTATATANGGTLPISYTWSNSQTTAGITGLPGGIYTVTVSDLNSCTATATATVTNIAGPSALLSNIIQETCTSSNGSVTASPTNGLPPYTYLWSNGVTNALNPGLSAGVYSVTITDGNNCLAMNTVTITDSPGPNASIFVITPATCGLTDGAATTTITSGTPPFIYNWSNGQAGQDLSGVMGGTYTFTVTDANGCKDTLTASINTLNGPTAMASSTDANCGASNGTASVIANGGSGTYTYLWSNGGNTATINNLNGGTYTVTVDDGSCQATDVITVSSLPGPLADFNLHPSTVLVGQDICYLTNNSTNGSTYLWDFGDGSTSTEINTSHIYDNLGIYIITLYVTDANGCVDSIQHEVTVNDEFIIYIPNTFTPNGDGKNDFFYPKGSYIDWNTYQMLIFDRWGKIIYQTTDINKPWDGTVNNTGLTDYVVMGTYTYYIYLKDLTGLKHKYFGLINIIP